MAKLSDNAHRQLIGYIGLVLPFLLIAIVLVRDGTERWNSLESVSAYYYTGAVAAFVGMLVSLALFLFTYAGYPDSKYNWIDRGASIIAAIASLGVAFFPTRIPTGLTALAWWKDSTGIIHYMSAAILFIMFAIFALWLFRLSDDPQPSADKQRRNKIYLVCGLVIVGCIVWAGISGGLYKKSIFWPESIALVAFAVSWLTKGYAVTTIVETTRSLLTRK